MRGRPTPQPPHMSEPILTVAAERTSQLLPNTLYISKTRTISYRRTKETFTTFFRRTKLFSLIRHAWMIITSTRTGRFSIGEFLRRKDAPYLIPITVANIDKKLRKKSCRIQQHPLHKGTLIDSVDFSAELPINNVNTVRYHITYGIGTHGKLD